MQTKNVGLKDLTIVSTVEELADEMALAEHSARKIHEIIEFRASNRNSGRRDIIVHVPNWVAKEHDHAGAGHRREDGTRDVVPDNLLLVKRVIDYSDKSYKITGAFWLDNDIILDESYSWDDFSVTEVTDPVDMTHEEWINKQGECWIPKKNVHLYSFKT